MKTTRLKMVILFCVIVVGSMMGEGFNASSQPYRYGGEELVYLDFRYIKIILKKSMLENLFELE